MKKLAAIACMACVFTVATAQAKQESEGGGSDTRIWLPIGISIVTPPLQMPGPSHFLIGAMLNLGYGQLDDVAVLDLGVVNNVTDSMIGLEAGCVNLAGDCFGVQVGGFNYASTVVGVQLGAVNMTGNLHGVQLGLLNFSKSGGALVFPIFNLGF